MSGNEFPAEISLTFLVETEAFTTARIAGSPRWTAPELLDMYDENEPIPSPEADVFAFGRVIFEVSCVLHVIKSRLIIPFRFGPLACLQVLTRKAPFFNIQNDATVALQVMKGINPRCPDDMPLSKEIRELLSRCWNSDRRKRPTAHQIVTALTRLWALEV